MIQLYSKAFLSPCCLHTTSCHGMLCSMKPHHPLVMEAPVVTPAAAVELFVVAVVLVTCTGAMRLSCCWWGRDVLLLPFVDLGKYCLLSPPPCKLPPPSFALQILRETCFVTPPPKFVQKFLTLFLTIHDPTKNTYHP